MKSKLVTVILLLVTCCLVGCGKEKETSIDLSAKKELESALDNLKNYDKPYVINSVMDAPGDKLCYLEVVSDKGVYTEYPLSADGTLTVDEVTEDTKFTITDWLTSDNQYYQIGADAEDSTKPKYTKLPEGYGEKCLTKKYIWVDNMLPKFTDIQKEGDETYDFGFGDENFTMYKCKLGSEDVKYLLGLGSYGLYDSVKQTNLDNTNIVKLCDYYISDLDMSLTFSDANVMVGVCNNLVRYINIEVGGLGSKLYLSKYISLDYNDILDVPDFSSSVDFVDSMQELADYLASSDNYDEAVNTLINGTGSGQQVTSEGESTEAPQPKETESNNKKSK